MTIHEFGKENEKVILLIHPSVVKWDYFEYVIPLLEKDYRLIVPALPGYDFDEESDFTSVEQIAEDLEYVSEVLKHCSSRTIWRTFDSCNNYKLPKPMPQVNTKIHYWFAENEQKARKADIKYMKEFFPDTVFGKYPNLGHAGLVLLKPELFAEKMRRLYVCL